VADGLPLGPALLACGGVNVALELGLERLAGVGVELEVVWGVIGGEGGLCSALEELELALLLAGEGDGGGAVEGGIAAKDSDGKEFGHERVHY
jgi:hypothetical protein